MSPEAIAVIVIILAGCLILGVVWELLIRGVEPDDLDSVEHHRALLRELRRHD
jgi:Tfp pilus assembly protein PilO